MFVSVKFFNYMSNAYVGMAYTYRTQMDLKPGDLVCCPTPKDPAARAMVVDVDVPEPKFKCKEITRIYTPEV